MFKKSDINISEIHRIVSLIKKVNCQGHAMITETASEMGVKKTALMQFIEDNPKLFTLVEVKKGDKVVGLGIQNVYTDPSQNPNTEEWLKVQKEKWADKIQVSGVYYYGQLEFYYIDVDSPNSKMREGLWRNTPQKIQTLIDAGVLKKVKTTYGGIGDAYNWEGYRLDVATTQAIKDLGWELISPEN